MYTMLIQHLCQPVTTFSAIFYERRGGIYLANRAAIDAAGCVVTVSRDRGLMSPGKGFMNSVIY